MFSEHTRKTSSLIKPFVLVFEKKKIAVFLFVEYFTVYFAVKNIGVRNNTENISDVD